MSKTPFLDFVKKLSKDAALRRRYYERVLAVFDGTGLSKVQVRAFCSGSNKLIAELLRQEWTDAGGQGELATPPMQHMPLNVIN